MLGGMSGVMMDGLSVLVVSWNQAERLGRCLASVREGLPGAQVVVVDNGSVPELVVDADVVVRCGVNVGYAGGNVLGVEHCTGEWVLLLNNDVVLPSGEPVMELVEFLRARPEVGAAQGRMVLPDGRLDACGELLNGIGLLHHCYYRCDVGRCPVVPYPVFSGKGAFLLVRRRAIAAAGGLFRAGYFCYYEDVDFCHRLWLAGYEVWFVPTVAVVHEERASSSLLPRRVVWGGYLSNMLTSAVELWGVRLWLSRGVFFLGALFVGGLLKGVFPRFRRERLVFCRRRSEGELLRWVTPGAHRRFLRGRSLDKVNDTILLVLGG